MSVFSMCISAETGQMSCACPQANVDAALPPEEWPLEALAKKMQQYCPMLSDLTAEGLAAESRGDYEALRVYLRRRGAEAYRDKVRFECFVCRMIILCCGAWKQKQVGVFTCCLVAGRLHAAAPLMCSSFAECHVRKNMV